MDQTYLFSRSIAGQTIEFYTGSRPGVHISFRTGTATVSSNATANTIERAISAAYDHLGLSACPMILSRRSQC